MLEVEAIGVRYGSIAGVQEVSLHVDQGEVVSLIGLNGAGKTTTLAAISGTVTPWRGSIRFEGRSLAGLPPERIVRQGIALVPEGRRIFSTLSVAENLRLGFAVRDDRGEAEAQLEQLIERLPILGERLHSPAGKLSGGEQQQLAIARALLTKPRLLLLDEPSLGLAPRIVDLVFEFVAELREAGVTILLVEQNAVRAAKLADRTYVLRNGKVAMVGTREELAGRADLAELYLGL